jgi:hypothetical protein
MCSRATLLNRFKGLNLSKTIRNRLKTSRLAIRNKLPILPKVPLTAQKARKVKEEEAIKVQMPNTRRAQLALNTSTHKTLEIKK